MKLVIAFDSFKGSLSAVEACDAFSRVLRVAGHEPVELPVADGGEGTTAALMSAIGGEVVRSAVSGPLPGRQVEGFWGWSDEKRIAVIEMAAASGLTLISEDERNPFLTTTRGTGELLLQAALKNPAHVLLGVGGSATVDGGTGAARALGWRFLDKQGRPVEEGGGSLAEISDIVPPDSRDLPPVEVLCDVTNPLTGPNGAARVFGPQKGASPDMVERLEDGLCRLAQVVKDRLGIDIDNIPGAGAAGGLAGGAVAWMNARLVPGIDHVLNAMNFEAACANADWIVTGEGKLDAQSLQGKVVSGVLSRVAKLDSKPRVAVIAGCVELNDSELRDAGIDYADAITPRDMPFNEAREKAAELMRDAADRFLTER